MDTLLDIVTAFFDAEQWAYRQLDRGDLLQLTANVEGVEWQCFARVYEVQSRLVFYSVYPTNVPEEKRPTVAEYVTRANFGLLLGNLEMDFSDGETRFKTSIDVQGDRLTPTLVRDLVYPNLQAMRQYMPGLDAILNDNASALDAIGQVE